MDVQPLPPAAPGSAPASRATDLLTYAGHLLDAHDALARDVLDYAGAMTPRRAAELVALLYFRDARPPQTWEPVRASTPTEDLVLGDVRAQLSDAHAVADDAAQRELDEAWMTAAYSDWDY